VDKIDNGKELPVDYEKRTWRNRMHVTAEGFIEIPGTAFANCIKESAKRLSIPVPGKGKNLYTKHFEAGIMVPDSLVLPVKAGDVECDELFVPSDGRRGGGKRVTKFFPRIDNWEGDVLFYVFDDLITEAVFRQALVAAGQLVGIGRFRPQSSGFYGRFSVKTLKWLDEAATLTLLEGAA
jgi:hypothetical protein